MNREIVERVERALFAEYRLKWPPTDRQRRYLTEARVEAFGGSGGPTEEWRRL